MADKSIRTHEQVNEMAKKVLAALEELPDFSIFGDDNSADKAEMLEWARDLREFLNYGENFAMVRSDAVRAWLRGEPSDLNDIWQVDE